MAKYRKEMQERFGDLVNFSGDAQRESCSYCSHLLLTNT
jgi:hypothetical protein